MSSIPEFGRNSYGPQRCAECENCGVELLAGAAFCHGCGKRVVQTTGGCRPPIPVIAGMHANIVGALCYVAGPLTGFVFLILNPYRQIPFVRFHGFQAIFLSVAWILVHFALVGLLGLVPWRVWHLIAMLSTFVSLAFACVSLLMMYKALRKERFKLPLVGDLAENQV